METASFELLENPSMTNNRMVWSGMGGQDGERGLVREDKSISTEVLKHTTPVPSPKRISGMVKEGDKKNTIEDNVGEGAILKQAEQLYFDDKDEGSISPFEGLVTTKPSPPPSTGCSIDKSELSWAEATQVSGGNEEISGGNEGVSGGNEEVEEEGIDGMNLSGRLQAKLEEKRVSGPSNGSWRSGPLSGTWRAQGPSNGTWRLARTLQPQLRHRLHIWTSCIVLLLSLLVWIGWHWSPHWLDLETSWEILQDSSLCLEREGGGLVCSNVVLDQVVRNVNGSFQSTIASIADLRTKMTTPIISIVTDFPVTSSTIVLITLSSCVAYILSAPTEGEKTKLKKKKEPINQPRTSATGNNTTGSSNFSRSIWQSSVTLVLGVLPSYQLILSLLAFSVLFLPALVLLNDQTRQVSWWKYDTEKATGCGGKHI